MTTLEKSAIHLVSQLEADTHPGKKPASATPKKNRMASRPSKLKTAAVQIVIIPQEIMMRPIHTDGEKYFIAKFEGASNITYGTKKTATAML